MDSENIIDRAHGLNGLPLTKLFKERAAAFDQKFEDLFGLRKKGFDQSQINFAKWSLSSLNGGVG